MLEDTTSADKLKFQWLITAVGVTLFLAKVIAWKITNSDAIFSDAMESTVNVIASFLGLYSLHLAAKPRDREHPYGHGKVEYITSGVEGVLIIIASLLIIYQSIDGLINHKELFSLDLGIYIVFATGVVNYIFGRWSIIKGKKENSPVLIASGKHLQTDTVTSVGITVSLVIVFFTGWTWFDSLAGLAYGTYIIFVGYHIIRDALGGVMDEWNEPLIEEVVKILEENRHIEWIDVHNMKIQQYGANLHIDAHVTLPWYYSLRDAHNELEKIMRLLGEKLNRPVEFNFHMDDCKPQSCKICQIMDCPVRKFAFEKRIKWDVDNVRSREKHHV